MHVVELKEQDSICNAKKLTILNHSYAKFLPSIVRMTKRPERRSDVANESPVKVSISVRRVAALGVRRQFLCTRYQLSVLRTVLEHKRAKIRYFVNIPSHYTRQYICEQREKKKDLATSERDEKKAAQRVHVSTRRAMYAGEGVKAISFW